MNIKKTKQTRIFEGYSVIERKTPVLFIDKSILELKIKTDYGVQVLMIKKDNTPFSDKDDNFEYIVPDSNYIIHEDDHLVLFGSDEKINELNKMD